MKYLIPKQLEAHGLKRGNIIFTEQSVRSIINLLYQGSRSKGFGKADSRYLQKGVRFLLETGRKRIRITPNNLHEYLGYHGLALIRQIRKTRLVWLRDLHGRLGGDTLYIEVTPMMGTGKLVLTDN